MSTSAINKANEIFYKMFGEIPQTSKGNISVEVAKQCSIIAVEAVLYALIVPPINNAGHILYDAEIEYWQMVKKEIENI